MDLFNELRRAVSDYDEWPTPEGRGAVVDLARRFVGAVDDRTAAIEHMRHTVTPSAEALQQLMTPCELCENAGKWMCPAHGRALT